MDEKLIHEKTDSERPAFFWNENRKLPAENKSLPSGEKKAGEKKDGKGYGTDASDRLDRVCLYIRTQVPGILRKADRGKPVQIQRGYGSHG